MYSDVNDRTTDEIQLAQDLIAFDSSNQNSIMTRIGAARENARQIREQISTEMWQQINELYLYVRNSRLDDVWNNQPSEFLDDILRGIHLEK